MTDLNIPDSVPVRPGGQAAEGVDLRQRHQSSIVNMQTGQVTVQTKGVQKASSTDMGTGSAVFTSVASRSGTIDDAGPSTIVDGPSLPGNGMELRFALAGGFIHKDPDGNYSAGPSTFQGDTAEGADADEKIKEAADEAKDGDDDKSEDGGGESLGDEVETSLNSIIADTNPHDQLAAVHQVAETGEVSEELITSAAQAMGIEPEALQGQVGTIIDAFETQARDAITKAAGVDSQVVLEWVWANRMDALNKAMIDQGTNRTTAGYTALAQDYVANLDTIDPDAILNATYPPGQSASRDSNGKIVITVDGVGYPWQSAARAGMVTMK